jgi:hypothetical protein
MIATRDDAEPGWSSSTTNGVFDLDFATTAGQPP